MRSYKQAACALVALAVLGAAPGAAPADFIISTFDTGIEGWTPGVSTAIVHQSTGGNPGGFLRVDDAGAIQDMMVFAPPAFLGDLSAFNGGRSASTPSPSSKARGRCS